MINCADCGHCMDFHTPTETQPKELTEVQKSLAEAVASWIKMAQQ